MTLFVMAADVLGHTAGAVVTAGEETIEAATEVAEGVRETGQQAAGAAYQTAQEAEAAAGAAYTAETGYLAPPGPVQTAEIVYTEGKVAIGGAGQWATGTVGTLIDSVAGPGDLVRPTLPPQPEPTTDLGGVVDDTPAEDEGMNALLPLAAVAAALFLLG